MTDTTTKALQQRREAHQSSIRLARHRATQLRNLADGNISLEELLEDPEMGRLEIRSVLEAIPFHRRPYRNNGIPRSTTCAFEILRHTSVKPRRTVGSLTDSSRNEILAATSKLAGNRVRVRKDDPKPAPLSVAKPLATVPANALDALEQANKVRRTQAKLRQQLREGTLTLEDALTEPALANWPIERLVTNLRRSNQAGDAWLNNLAPKTARKILAAHRISPYQKVRDFGETGRKLLVLIFTDARFCPPNEEKVQA